MPTKDGRITPKEQAFVRHMVATGDSSYAAIRAGYSHPVKRALEVLKRPAIQQEIVAQQNARLMNEALPLAVSKLIEILGSDKTQTGHRLSAIKITLDKAQEVHGVGANGKTLADMSLRELQQMAARAAAEREELESITIDVELNPGGVFD